MKKLLFLLFLGSAAMSCKTIKPVADVNTVELSGTIQELGMSTFQYGTHLLKSEGKTYALKASTIKLDNFIGKAVKVKGIKVEGYPVENGPELIDVKEIY